MSCLTKSTKFALCTRSSVYVWGMSKKVFCEVCATCIPSGMLFPYFSLVGKMHPLAQQFLSRVGNPPQLRPVRFSERRGALEQEWTERFSHLCRIFHYWHDPFANRCVPVRSVNAPGFPGLQFGFGLIIRESFSTRARGFLEARLG